MKGSPSSQPRISETDAIQSLNHGPFKASRVPASVAKRNEWITPGYSHACRVAERHSNVSVFCFRVFTGGALRLQGCDGRAPSRLASSLPVAVSLVCPAAPKAKQRVTKILTRKLSNDFRKDT